MKRIISILLFLFAIQTVNAQDYTQYCSTKIPNKTFSGMLASTSGFNLLSRNIIESEISNRLKKELNSKFDVKINNFYGTNILNGSFKDLSATTDKINYGGFYLSNINAKTLCNYNQVEYKDKKLTFKENMVLKYASTITQEDLNNTINSTEYKKIIEKMNKDEYISSVFKIEPSKLEISDNGISMQYSIYPLPKINSSIVKNFLQPIKININGNLKAKDGQLELCDLTLNSKKANYIPPSLINLLNPLNYNIDVQKGKKGKLDIDNITIKDKKIQIDGYIVILKD